jgi:MoxR-like ATPase
VELLEKIAAMDVDVYLGGHGDIGAKQDVLNEAQMLGDFDHGMRAAIAKAIVGQDAVVEQLLIGLLAGGHCLLEGVPGLGKTLLVRSLGRHGPVVRRIQLRRT